MALHLVTGYAGKEHVTAADQGAFNVAMLIDGNYVLNRGEKFAATIVTNNLIKVLDGEIILQGRYIRLDSGSFEELAIDSGTQDYKRNDLIVCRYTKSSTTGVESAALVVLKGTQDSAIAIDPEYTTGDTLHGDLCCDFPLYRVPIDGLTVGELEPLFEVVDSFSKQMEGKANKTHSHKKADIADFDHSHSVNEITDFPTSMTPIAHKHTTSDISNFPTTMTPSAHNQAASTITAGTLGGQVVANAAAVANIATKQVRNIYAGTAELTAGASALPAGDIYFQIKS